MMRECEKEKPERVRFSSSCKGFREESGSSKLKDFDSDL